MTGWEEHRKYGREHDGVGTNAAYIRFDEHLVVGAVSGSRIVARRANDACQSLICTLSLRRTLTHRGLVCPCASADALRLNLIGGASKRVARKLAQRKREGSKPKLDRISLLSSVKSCAHLVQGSSVDCAPMSQLSASDFISFGSRGGSDDYISISWVILRSRAQSQAWIARIWHCSLRVDRDRVTD